MLLPDHIYRRVPFFWMLMGILSIVLGILARPDLPRVGAYVLLGFVSIGRSLWLYQARQRVARHGEVTVLTETQKLDRRAR
jgi:hypothetical protein